MSKNKKYQQQRIHDNKGSTLNTKEAQAKSAQPVHQPLESKPVNITEPVTLTFNATDTLFFRESRPMESMGELQSVFPPPIRTLAGAVRTLIGESIGVNWHDYENDEQHPLRQVIGFSDQLGNLKLQGAWLSWDSERLYPAPLHLLKKDDTLYRLELDKTGTWCDLGEKVRLPILPKEAAGSKPLENTWLTAAGLQAVLNGNLPKKEEIKTAKDLFQRESRLGIARNNASRTVEEGMLYQTQHIRPHTELAVQLDVEGLPKEMPPKAIIRLGGEGRTASVTAQARGNPLPSIANNTKTKGLLLYLLTPLPIQTMSKTWQPLPGFERVEPDAKEKHTIWTGTLNGIELELHGAVTGKVLREGGWDMAKHQPRPVSSLIPAGSVFFCTVKDGNTAAAIKALHNQHIQQIGIHLTAYGYGHLAVGIWND